MCRVAVISPHTDDAIFSIGEHLWLLDDVTIITPFAGIPSDPEGKAKHTILRQEHSMACSVIGADMINGDFLDDVYPDRDEQKVISWLESQLKGFDIVYVPLGIHHPDHVFIASAVRQMNLTAEVVIYAEQPYSSMYPDQTEELLNSPAILSSRDAKRLACSMYRSQLQGEIVSHLYKRERMFQE